MSGNSASPVSTNFSLVKSNVTFNKYGMIQKPHKAKNPTVVDIPMAPPKTGNYVLQPGCSELKIGDYYKENKSYTKTKDGAIFYTDTNKDGKIDGKTVLSKDMSRSSSDFNYDGKVDSKRRIIYYPNSKKMKEVLIAEPDRGFKELFTKTGKSRGIVNPKPLSEE